MVLTGMIGTRRRTRSVLALTTSIAILPLLCPWQHCLWAVDQGAQTVQVWVTVSADGDRKDAHLGAAWDDANRYGIEQDGPYQLLRRDQVAPSEVPAATIGVWRIEVDADAPQQTLRGVGAALTDASAYLLWHLKQRNGPLYEFTMQRLFSPTDGAGFSYLRRPLGSSDYTATESYYTYADQESADLSSFSIAHDRAVYSARAARRAAH